MAELPLTTAEHLLEELITTRNHLFHLLNQPIMTGDEYFERKVKTQISIVEETIKALVSRAAPPHKIDL